MEQSYLHNEKIPLEAALDALLERAPSPDAYETVSLFDALGRIGYADLPAVVDAPPFAASPLDGFAARHADLAGACAEQPAVLAVAETLYAGDPPAQGIRPGTCARVMTGAAIPPGADCVVPYEDTDNGAEQVRIRVSLKAYQNYRFQGEDLRAGRVIIAKGERIAPAHIGVLAGQGYTEIPVFARPRIGILSTGSELMPGGRPLEPGKIYDSNRFMLSAKVTALGGEPVCPAPSADDPEQIAESLNRLLQTCGLAVTTGGVSVGDRDYMPAVGRLIGAEPVFRGVQMKPGGWITALYRQGRLILCLSGNPGAASLSFDLLAGPVIRRLTGSAQVLPRRIHCVLQEPFPKASPERRFLYAAAENGIVRFSSAGFGSASPALAVGCNGVADIPAGTPPLPAGGGVTVILSE